MSKKKDVLGTWNRVTVIMKQNGFNVKKGKYPIGLESQIRDMLSQAYIVGYSDGGKNGTEWYDYNVWQKQKEITNKRKGVQQK